MGAVAEFERALNADQVQELKIRANAHENKTKIAKDLGISRQTLYKYWRS